MAVEYNEEWIIKAVKDARDVINEALPASNHPAHTADRESLRSAAMPVVLQYFLNTRHA